MARVRLDYDTKTVADGALFYEEYLPPETLFYSVVLANGARSTSTRRLLDGGRVLEVVKETCRPSSRSAPIRPRARASVSLA